MAGLTPLLGKSGPLVSAVYEVIQEVPRLRSTAGQAGGVGSRGGPGKKLTD